jgi:ABC-type molybdate transport system substrate-binding protein
MKLLQAHAMLEPLHEKLVPMPASKTIEAVASGEVTYGVQLVSEIVSVKGAKLVGPLPLEYQSPTQLTIGCSTDPCGAGSAALIDFLSSADAADAIRAAGMVVP